MRSLSTLSLCALLILAVGCDTVVDPETIDAPALIPLSEGNVWELERVHHSTGDVAHDSLVVTSVFSFEHKTWARIEGGTAFAGSAGGYLSRGDDGYYHSARDPREFPSDVRLRYRYPAEPGEQYVLEATEGLVTGDIYLGTGRVTVTVLSTNEMVHTPLGERQAYRYGFAVETYFIDGTEYEAVDLGFERVFVPEIGFQAFTTGFVSYGEQPGTVTGSATIELTLTGVHLKD